MSTKENPEETAGENPVPQAGAESQASLQDDNMDVDEDVDASSRPEDKNDKDASDGASDAAADAEESKIEKSQSSSKAPESDGHEQDGPASVDRDNEEDDNEDQDQEDEDKEEEDKDSDDKNGAGTDIDPIYDQTLMKPIFERRDKSLKELLDAMDEFSPIIPDAVTDYYLTRAGFRTSDVRIKRLLALATQKFVADIANDAYQFSRIRAQSGNAAGGVARGRMGPGSSSGRTVLTMESLSGVLEDYGVNAKRPDFFR